MTKDVATWIGNRLGKLKDVEIEPNGEVWGSSLRIRVAVNITKPLKRAMKIQTVLGDEQLLRFTYERLPNFCYFCGHLGHTTRSCELQYSDGFVDPGENTPIGAWLRAIPPTVSRRRHANLASNGATGFYRRPTFHSQPHSTQTQPRLYMDRGQPSFVDLPQHPQTNHPTAQHQPESHIPPQPLQDHAHPATNNHKIFDLNLPLTDSEPTAATNSQSFPKNYYPDNIVPNTHNNSPPGPLQTTNILQSPRPQPTAVTTSHPTHCQLENICLHTHNTSSPRPLPITNPLQSQNQSQSQDRPNPRTYKKTTKTPTFTHKTLNHKAAQSTPSPTLPHKRGLLDETFSDGEPPSQGLYKFGRLASHLMDISNFPAATDEQSCRSS
ncbi:UNVERIFIED_CONTAM: hypothetical protein Slati_3512500 [Sesamum latifolium]|uniref:CCHC-type domain-containing protein n=1 Tax=Sesamum latifolium TaxID=2727402 RepID=A0AAW2ULC5_9LAMI